MRLWRALGAATVAIGLMLGIVGVASAHEDVTRTSYEQIRTWPNQQKVGDRIKVSFSRFDTANMAGAGAGVVTAALSRAGLPTWISPIVGAAARDAAYKGGKCLTVELNQYFGWLPNVNAYPRSC